MSRTISLQNELTWLVLMHQIPPKPEAFRVKIWRALQKIGALQLKNSVYVLPLTEENQTAFEGLIKEVNSGNGDAFLCQSQFVQGITSKDIVNQFCQDREQRFSKLADGLRGIQKSLSATPKTENSLMKVEHGFGKIERQILELAKLDFFECKQRKPTLKLLGSVHSSLQSLKQGNFEGTVERKEAKDFQKRVWVTRTGLYVDRLACAWLISSFIDRKASFRFVSETNYKPKKNEVRFDMFDAEFTHVGDKCSFEVLVESFSIDDKPVRILAEIVHDLDLKDTKFNRPETVGIGIVIDGITKSERSDDARMTKASVLFNDLVATLKG